MISTICLVMAIPIIAQGNVDKNNGNIKTEKEQQRNDKDLITKEEIKNKIYSLVGKGEITEGKLLDIIKLGKITIQDIYKTEDNAICVLANKFSQSYDSDKDGLSDYDEIFKYKTNPNSRDSDNDGVDDSDWNERREYTYSISFKTKIFNIYDEKDMSTGFQDYKIINKTDRYTEFEIITYPENTYYSHLYRNSHWKSDYESMQQYLEPSTLCNWDEQMKKDLIAQLKKDGIDIEKLSDVDLVRQVVQWIEKSNRRLYTNGWDIFLETANGKVKETTDKKIIKKIQKAFPTESFEEIRDSMVLGKEMYYNKTIGECLSSSTYYATIFRALGIPTRVVAMIPMGNYNDLPKLDHIQSNEYKEKVYKNFNYDGWANHYHTQVFIGNIWVDVEYARVGNNFGTDRYLGYITFNNVVDFSDMEQLVWKYWYNHMYVERDKNFKSWVPYEISEAKDCIGIYSKSY